MPVGSSPASPVDHRAGVDGVGQPAGLVDQPLVPPAVDAAGVGRKPAVDLGPVVSREAGGLTRDQGGPPLAGPPRPQRGVGVRHLPGEGLGEPQVPGPSVRRLPASERDLGGGAAHRPLGCDPLTRRAGTVQGTLAACGQRRTRPSLRSRCCSLQLLQAGDQVDEVGLRGNTRSSSDTGPCAVLRQRGAEVRNSIEESEHVFYYTHTPEVTSTSGG